jgi:hypothetical protein
VSIDKAGKEPLVILTLAGRKIALPVRDAHEIGAKLTGSAIEVEIQGFLIDWITRHISPLDLNQASALAMQFREYLRNARKD